MYTQDPIRPGQKFVLIKLCENFVGQDREARLFLIARLLGKEVKSTNDLTIGDWQKIRNEAYPRWCDDDWTVGNGFTKKARTIYRQYQTEVLGQLSMF
jgi:hypothetical protein